MRWNLSGTSVFGALRPKRPAESLPGPVTTAWHEVCVHLQRQARVGVPEVLREGHPRGGVVSSAPEPEG